MKLRAIILLACTLAGIALGLSGDFLASEDPIKFQDVKGALLLSPIAVTAGGGIVSLAVGLPAALIVLPLFLLGGCSFWPVYALFAWLWLRKGVRWMWLGILLWTAQGYFMVVHRFWMLMSA